MGSSRSGAAAAASFGIVLVTILGLPGGAALAEEELPVGVQQLLPRGRIAAVFEPEFVAAYEAEIPDDAWVLGVAMGGEARAYSLNLLNRHEVVNDVLGGRSIAAVW